VVSPLVWMAHVSCYKPSLVEGVPATHHVVEVQVQAMTKPEAEQQALDKVRALGYACVGVKVKAEGKSAPDQRPLLPPPPEEEKKDDGPVWMSLAEIFTHRTFFATKYITPKKGAEVTSDSRP